MSDPDIRSPPNEQISTSGSKSQTNLDYHEITSPMVIVDSKQSNNLNNDPKLKSPAAMKGSYKKRNQDLIKQLQEKNLRMAEEAEKIRKKEQGDREKLKEKILDQAAKVREEKKKQLESQPENSKEEISKKEFDAKKKKTFKKENDHEEINIKPLEEGSGTEKDKLNNYYRSRHATFLHALQDEAKNKKLTEEQEKKKKEDLLLKIREKMGLNNITSKVFEAEKKEENENKGEVKGEGRGRKMTNNERDHDRCLSADNPNNRLTFEAQQKLLDKQKKMLMQIAEKKKSEQLQEEEVNSKKAKIREKLKQKVLSLTKTTTGEFEKIDKDSPSASSTLKGLNLAEGKSKSFKNRTSLPAIKARKKEDDEDGDDDDDQYEQDDDDDEEDDATKSPSKKKENKSKKSKLPIYPNITDLATWKKKHRLDPETRVFIVIGGYGALKRALESRGWVENPDSSSLCFDLKWTLKAKDICTELLQEFQIVNHFQRNTSITTKVGLCKSLRNLIWFANVDIDAFYPRCYDMSDPNDLEDFVEDFKFIKAEVILKKYLRAAEAKDTNVGELEEKMQVALNVCKKRLKNIDELLDDPKGITQSIITKEEWEVIGSDEMTEEGLAQKKHEAWFSKLDSTFVPRVGIAKPKKEKKKKKKKKIVTANEQNKEGNTEQVDEEGEEDEEEEDVPQENPYIKDIRNTLQILKEKYPQSGLNGENNIWIVKPAGLSRGRGISCHKHLVEILDLIKHEGQWVVQKYMENPLVVLKRKFDIRQWVLVTDWNPLTIWFYEECYIRFGAEDYTLDNLDNRFIHLTNNSVTKNSKEEQHKDIEGNMWTCQALEEHLKTLHPEGKNIFQEKIKPDMKQIVTWSLESVQDMIENKKNSVELYGYDFMIDEELNVWLIEINSSPAMDYSTPITEKLVKMVLEDTVKVIVDHGMSKKKKKKDIDTGLFTCIHKSKRIVDKPLTSFGLDLVLEGKAISKK